MKDIPAGNRSVMSLYGYIYDRRATAKGKSRWFCKANELHQYAYSLKESFPDCKFIYNVRDPRDAALSFMKAAVGPATIFRASEIWNSEQNRCIKLLNEPSFKSSVFLLHYEDLLKDPVGTTKKICEFLDEPFEEKMLEPDKRSGATKFQYWKNLSKPIMRDNYNKYKSQLSKRQILIIESMNRRNMRYLGYELEYPDERYNIGLIARGTYMIGNGILGKVRGKAVKGEELDLRIKKGKVIKRIKKRYLVE